MMVTWTRKVVVELERNRPIFEVVTIGFVDELKVWDEGQERNQGWLLTLFYFFFCLSSVVDIGAIY